MRTQINRKSDFDFIITNADGDIITMPDCDWELILWTWGSSVRYKASYIGGVYMNCKEESGGIRIYVDNPGFVQGKLVGEMWTYTGNDGYNDKTQRSCTYINDFNIDLVAGESMMDNVNTIAMMQYIKGESAYQIACDYGFVGTEEEWLNSLSEPSLEAAAQCQAMMNEFAEAELARVNAEEERKSAELSRYTNELYRSAEETWRIQNEKDRIAAESERNSAEQSRKEAELARVEEYNSLKLDTYTKQEIDDKLENLGTGDSGNEDLSGIIASINSLESRVTDTESQIIQNAEDLLGKAEKTEVELVSNDVNNLTNSVQANATNINTLGLKILENAEKISGIGYTYGTDDVESGISILGAFPTSSAKFGYILRTIGNSFHHVIQITEAKKGDIIHVVNKEADYTPIILVSEVTDDDARDALLNDSEIDDAFKSIVNQGSYDAIGVICQSFNLSISELVESGELDFPIKYTSHDFLVDKDGLYIYIVWDDSSNVSSFAPLDKTAVTLIREPYTASTRTYTREDIDGMLGDVELVLQTING